MNYISHNALNLPTTSREAFITGRCQHGYKQQTKVSKITLDSVTSSFVFVWEKKRVLYRFIVIFTGTRDCLRCLFSTEAKLSYLCLWCELVNSLLLRMYTLLSGLYKYMFQKDEYCVLILGLDNAGKTVRLVIYSSRHFSVLVVHKTSFALVTFGAYDAYLGKVIVKLGWCFLGRVLTKY